MSLCVWFQCQQETSPNAHCKDFELHLLARGISSAMSDLSRVVVVFEVITSIFFASERCILGYLLLLPEAESPLCLASSIVVA